MKKAMKSLLALSFAVIVSSCSGGSQNKDMATNSSKETEEPQAKPVQQKDAEFENASAKAAYDHYMEIKTALVNSNAEGAQKAATQLAEGLDNQYPKVKKTATALAASTDIEEQRSQFSELTREMEPVLKESITSGAIYKQYCPMAFNNQGGYWLSDVKEIKNPYFGSKMLRCGSTKETISRQ